MFKLELKKKVRFGGIHVLRHHWDSDPESGVLIVERFGKGIELSCEVSIPFHMEKDKFIADINLSFEEPEGCFRYRDCTGDHDFTELICKGERIYPSDIIKLNNDSLKYVLKKAKRGNSI